MLLADGVFPEFGLGILPRHTVGNPLCKVVDLSLREGPGWRHPEITVVPNHPQKQAGIGIPVDYGRSGLSALEQGCPGVHAESALRLGGVAAEALGLKHRPDAIPKELSGRKRPRRPDLDPAGERLKFMSLDPISVRRHAHAPLDALDRVEKDTLIGVARLNCRP